MDPRKRFAATPINRHLGFELERADPDRAEVVLRALDDFVQEEDVVHGGMIATLADTAAVYVVLPEIPEEAGLTSIEFKINFLRPARAGAGELRAVATPVRRGRKVVVCRVEVSQGDRPVAEGLFTYLVLPAPLLGSPR